MTGETSLREIVSHPASYASGIVALLGGVLQLPLLTEIWSWLLVQAPQLFGGVSIFAFTVAPEISPELASWLKPIAIALAIIAGGKRLYSSAKSLRERF